MLAMSATYGSLPSFACSISDQRSPLHVPQTRCGADKEDITKPTRQSQACRAVAHQFAHHHPQRLDGWRLPAGTSSSNASSTPFRLSICKKPANEHAAKWLWWPQHRSHCISEEVS